MFCTFHSIPLILNLSTQHDFENFDFENEITFCLVRLVGGLAELSTKRKHSVRTNINRKHTWNIIGQVSGCRQQ